MCTNKELIPSIPMAECRRHNHIPSIPAACVATLTTAAARVLIKNLRYHFVGEWQHNYRHHAAIACAIIWYEHGTIRNGVWLVGMPKTCATTTTSTTTVLCAAEQFGGRLERSMFSALRNHYAGIFISANSLPTPPSPHLSRALSNIICCQRAPIVSP